MTAPAWKRGDAWAIELERGTGKLAHCATEHLPVLWPTRERARNDRQNWKWPRARVVRVRINIEVMG